MRYNVNGVKMRLLEDEILVAGSVKVYNAEFDFDGTWNEYITRTAVFKHGDTVVEQLIVDGRCEIPWEVLTTHGVLHIGVYGENGEKRRPTLWASPKTVSVGTEKGETAREATADMWQQLLTSIDDAVPHIGENGNWYVGESNTGVPAQGPQGLQGPQGDKGDKGDKGEQGIKGETGPRGENYVLTDDDKSEIVDGVLAALPVWELDGGEY